MHEVCRCLIVFFAAVKYVYTVTHERIVFDIVCTEISDDIGKLDRRRDFTLSERFNRKIIFFICHILRLLLFYIIDNSFFFQYGV